MINHEVAAVTDRFSALAPEIARPILAYVGGAGDPCALARLCRISKLWSVRVSDDALWRPLFLAKWRMPRSLAGAGAALSSERRHDAETDCLAIADGDHDRADAAAEPIEKVAWKKLYQCRLALEERWRSGEPTIRPAFPYLGGLVIAIHADYVVMKSKRFFRILKRLDGSYVEIPNANNAGVWCADVDADATVIVTGSLDQAVRLWDAATCKCTLVLEGHRSPVVRVRFIGDYIFSRSSTETRLWNRNSGALLHNFDNATGEFKDWNASAVGIFSLSRDGTVKLWNLETGMCDRILVEGGGPNPVLELAKLHTWGTRFAVESMAPARHFCVYDTQTRALVSTLPPPGSYGYATDPDGAPFVKRLGHGKGFEVWDLESGRKLRDFQVHGELNVAVGRNEICYVDNYRVEWMEMNFGLGIPYSNEF